MDLIKAKTILSRLQSMHQSLETNSQLSALERDLILNYLRELYEIYLETEVHALPVLKATLVAASAKTEEKDPVQKTLEFKFDTEDSLKTNEEIAPTLSSPIVEPLQVEEEIKVVLPSNPTPFVAPVPVVLSEPKRAPISDNPLVNKLASIPASIIELFEIKKGSELSDKLNELPLRDINRGIGINDRLEMVNTLFGGQKQLFEQIITDLNTFKNFEEARDLLGAGPAVHYKWDHVEIRDKAVDFIKLIRRRYL